MKELAAYCLLVLSGKANPCKITPLLAFSHPHSAIAADDVTKVLKEVGVQSNKEDMDALMTAVGGKKLHELVRDGSKKLASVPAAGAVAGKLQYIL